MMHQWKSWLNVVHCSGLSLVAKSLHSLQVNKGFSMPMAISSSETNKRQPSARITKLMCVLVRALGSWNLWLAVNPRLAAVIKGIYAACIFYAATALLKSTSKNPTAYKLFGFIGISLLIFWRFLVYFSVVAGRRCCRNRHNEGRQIWHLV